MWKYIIFLNVLSAYCATGQIYVGDYNLNEDMGVSHIIAARRFTGTVVVDYGQQNVRYYNTNIVTDSTGLAIKMNSLADMLMFFEKNGWAYRDQILTGSEDDISTESFLFIRKNDQIKDAE